jgi:hypothetical protein
VSYAGDWFILDMSTTLVLNQLLPKLAIQNSALNTNIIGELLEAWRKLSVTCGTGIDSRTRLWDNPAPADDGNDCTGPSSETRACVLHPCRKLFI